MVKVNCKDRIEPGKSEYPCLKKSGNHGRMVLFIAPKTGFELDGGVCSTNFNYSETWAEYDFGLYTGTVELSNEL